MRLNAHQHYSRSRLIQPSKWAKVIQTAGIKRLQNAGAVLVLANHPTYIDFVVLLSLTPNANCVVKSEHWDNPVFGEGGEELRELAVRDHGAARSVYFRDPYGHRLEVTTYDPSPAAVHGRDEGSV